MGHYFFDTSGLVKRHVNESGTRWVRNLTRVRAGHLISLAEITTVEMVAAITRRQRGGSRVPHKPARSSIIFAATVATAVPFLR